MVQKLNNSPQFTGLTNPFSQQLLMEFVYHANRSNSLLAGDGTEAATGPVRFETLTVATLPSAATYPAGVVYLSDINAFAYSNGTTWFYFTNRERLTANRTYFVRSDGSNSNNGLTNTAGGAFLTLQFAYDYVAGNLDFGGFTVTIQIDGASSHTYTGGLTFNKPWSGGGSLIIKGSNAGTPSNVLISASSSAFVNLTTLPGLVTIQDLKITSSGGFGILNDATGTISFSNIDFGAVAFDHIGVRSNAAIISCVGLSYIISGASRFHLHSAYGGFINVFGNSVTITGSPAVTVYCYAELLSIMETSSQTFTGAFTGGKKFNVINNSVVNTNGTGGTNFPGANPGTTDGKGIII